jgi:hypothetical protein
MGIRYDQANLLYNAPTNASITSSSQPIRGFGSGWVEFFVPHTGEAEGTLSLKGGNDALQTTHHDLSIDDSYIFINGLNLQDNAFTGITWAATAPSTLVIAAAQVADARIRIPVVNLPAYISAVWTCTGGGSASQYIQCIWYGQAGT